MLFRHFLQWIYSIDLTVVVDGNHLFMLKIHNNVLSYCSIIIGVAFAELILYGILCAAHMYCYIQAV